MTKAEEFFRKENYAQNWDDLQMSKTILSPNQCINLMESYCGEGNKTIALLNGYKMILPHYAKWSGVYGYFTTEGFVSLYCDVLEIEPIEYNKIFKGSQDDFESIDSPLM